MHLNISKMVSQSSRPESLAERNINCLQTVGERVRCNLLITRELFHIQMLLQRLEDGCGHLTLPCLVSCRISVTCKIPFALSDHTIGLITVQCQELNGKHPTLLYYTNSTMLRTDLQCNKVVQPSSELKEQHKMARLFTGGRDGKKIEKN